MKRTNQLLQRCMQYPILSGEEKFPERTKTIIEDRIVCGPRERLEAYMLGVHQIQSGLYLWIKILQIALNPEKNTGIESSENKLKLNKFNNENITVK